MSGSALKLRLGQLRSCPKDLVIDTNHGAKNFLSACMLTGLQERFVLFLFVLFLTYLVYDLHNKYKYMLGYRILMKRFVS